jgi:hypothetical protein
MKTKLIRHGDLALVKISKLPTGLKETKTKVLMSGSHGNNHFINQGKVYLTKVDDYVFGYLRAKDTTLDHPEHGKIKLDNGVYELRRQIEFTVDGLKPVVD